MGGDRLVSELFQAVSRDLGSTDLANKFNAVFVLPVVRQGLFNELRKYVVTSRLDWNRLSQADPAEIVDAISDRDLRRLLRATLDDISARADGPDGEAEDALQSDDDSDAPGAKPPTDTAKVVLRLLSEAVAAMPYRLFHEVASSISSFDVRGVVDDWPNRQKLPLLLRSYLLRDRRDTAHARKRRALLEQLDNHFRTDKSRTSYDEVIADLRTMTDRQLVAFVDKFEEAIRGSPAGRFLDSVDRVLTESMQGAPREQKSALIVHSREVMEAINTLRARLRLNHKEVLDAFDDLDASTFSTRMVLDRKQLLGKFIPAESVVAEVAECHEDHYAQIFGLLKLQPHGVVTPASESVMEVIGTDEESPTGDSDEPAPLAAAEEVEEEGCLVEIDKDIWELPDPGDDEDDVAPSAAAAASQPNVKAPALLGLPRP
eukprot:NODE_572_length_1343_cov_123.135240_g446_i0.p1 GENE.NODE_572_length_1343_cov_123.135240_g446_i0~~NODE_572_length_1343_cov_123.135240_g446_i0.p1  ORF type:complete len:439 (+),score=183.60 NODE_572_length_1343_cov_123.135240_g446_i0:26-1318(+)